MGTLDFRIDLRGIEEAVAQLDPKRAHMAITRWFTTATAYVRNAMRGRAPQSLRDKIKVRFDGYQPPRWARVAPRSRIAHLIEGGTRPKGAAGFTHVAKFKPSPFGIMRQMKLESPAQAIAIARAIEKRGGTAAEPFIKPTQDATESRVYQMADDAVKWAWRQK